jgi:hypothetical protein
MDMKNFLTICLFLIPSISFAVNTYLVMDWKNDTKIILHEKQCMVSGLTGGRAIITKFDGSYIRGCWNYVDNGKHIRIDWDNPNAPGDFAILDVKYFYPVKE